MELIVYPTLLTRSCYRHFWTDGFSFEHLTSYERVVFTYPFYESAKWIKYKLSMECCCCLIPYHWVVVKPSVIMLLILGLDQLSNMLNVIFSSWLAATLCKIRRLINIYFSQWNFVISCCWRLFFYTRSIQIYTIPNVA